MKFAIIPFYCSTFLGVCCETILPASPGLALALGVPKLRNEVEKWSDSGLQLAGNPLQPAEFLQLADLYEKIFNKEAELKELFDEEKITKEQFLERHQQEVKPLFDNLHEWLLEKKNREILETSKTKQAINYCLNRWENLTLCF